MVSRHKLLLKAVKCTQEVVNTAELLSKLILVGQSDLVFVCYMRPGNAFPFFFFSFLLSFSAWL